MTLTYQELVSSFPELGPMLDEHKADFDEILPTLFMADVARWAAAHVADQRGRVSELTDWLESHYVADTDEVNNLIGVGFVESLPRHDEPGAEVLGLLGPELSACAREMGLTEG